jgi:acetate kinase
VNILALNTGSSSVKFQLIGMETETCLVRGVADRIGAAEGLFVSEAAGREKLRERRRFASHEEALERIVQALEAPQQIAGVGHRIVHGGDRFSESVVIDGTVAAAIAECAVLAPLHNPHNLTGYRLARRLLPHAVQVAVFDTAFHQTLPPHAYHYPLPRELCERHRLRRYGFHGTSHRYVAGRWEQLTGQPLERSKLITLHLGNGCSACAIDGGRSVDTSMGLTPLEGLPMGTRSGDVDPAVVLYLMEREGLDAAAMDALLNKRSGLLGVSGLSNDMRSLLEAEAAGHAGAALAVGLFCYRIRRYLGAYSAVLNGATAVIFTGGIGENAPAVRARACANLDALGIELDPAANAGIRGAEGIISTAGARTAVWVIPTNEELLIARDTVQAIAAARRAVPAPA